MDSLLDDMMYSLQLDYGIVAQVAFGRVPTVDPRTGVKITSATVREPVRMVLASAATIYAHIGSSSIGYDESTFVALISKLDIPFGMTLKVKDEIIQGATTYTVTSIRDYPTLLEVSLSVASPRV